MGQKKIGLRGRPAGEACLPLPSVRTPSSYHRPALSVSLQLSAYSTRSTIPALRWSQFRAVAEVLTGWWV